MLLPVLLLCAVILFRFPEYAVHAVSTGLRVCAGTVIPALFPFFVLTDLWIRLGNNNKLLDHISPIMTKVFHAPGVVSSAFLLGAISGYPIGAQTIATLHIQKQLSKQDAEQALFFCCNAGPAFVFGILGAALFHSAMIGAALWAIHLLSAIFLGFLFRPEHTANISVTDTRQKQEPFLPALTQAIQNGGATAIRISIFIVFFSILAEYLQHLFPPSLISTILLGSLELASGTVRLGQSGISQETAFVISAGLLGWGGLCVHCQTVSILHAAHLDEKRYIYGKLLHGILSVALACLVAPFLPLKMPCFSSGSPPPIGAITLLISLLVLLILKTSSGKMSEHRI